MSIAPRLIRQKDAFGYLGMDRNRFDKEVRPKLTEIPIGERSIAYDRYELDYWADEYIAKYGRKKDVPSCVQGQAEFKSPQAGKDQSIKGIVASESSSDLAKSPKTKPKNGCETNKLKLSSKSRRSVLDVIRECSQMAAGNT